VCCQLGSSKFAMDKHCVAIEFIDFFDEVLAGIASLC
jgi:hypothetical protein